MSERRKGGFVLELEEIKGVGPAVAKRLKTAGLIIGSTTRIILT